MKARNIFFIFTFSFLMTKRISHRSCTSIVEGLNFRIHFFFFPAIGAVLALFHLRKQKNNKIKEKLNWRVTKNNDREKISQEQKNSLRFKYVIKFINIRGRVTQYYGPKNRYLNYRTSNILHKFSLALRIFTSSF